MHKRGEPCVSAPRVSVGRYRNRISNFQLIFLIALPASRAFIIARNTLFTSLQSQVANLKLASVRALSLVACIVRLKQAGCGKSREKSKKSETRLMTEFLRTLYLLCLVCYITEKHSFLGVLFSFSPVSFLSISLV